MNKNVSWEAMCKTVRVFQKQGRMKSTMATKRIQSKNTTIKIARVVYDFV